MLTFGCRSLLQSHALPRKRSISRSHLFLPLLPGPRKSQARLLRKWKLSRVSYSNCTRLE